MNQSTHPIVQLLIERQKTGSKPNKRSDSRKVALAIEGGGMRGVVSAGMVAGLEQLALTDAFDAVYGASAGAVNGAYFVAKQARYGTTIFYEDINNRHFIDVGRFFKLEPILSLEFLLDFVCVKKKVLAVDRILNSSIPLIVVASSLARKESAALSNFVDAPDLFEALRCSARIPFIAGPPVRYRDELFVDASVYESIPFRAAESAGYTDIVALLTRPFGDRRNTPGWIDRLLVAPHLRRFSVSAAAAYMNRHKSYADDLEVLYSRADGSSYPRLLLIQKPAHLRKVLPFNTSREALVAGAKAGFRAVYSAIGLDLPDMVEILTPADLVN
jgi:predicted patatin/cPLA2 family phospholipase